MDVYRPLPPVLEQFLNLLAPMRGYSRLMGGQFHIESFAGLVLRASMAMGAPVYLAKHLGVEPYDVYRWIAGTNLPEAVGQKDVEQRLLSMLEKKRVDSKLIEPRDEPTRRRGDCLI